MTDRLYIIGNGFDLYHKIPSTYQAFGEYLKKKDDNVYNCLEEYFDLSGRFWSDFEESLAYLDKDSLIDDASIFLKGYGADDWSDSYHHDFQFEIERVSTAISSHMKKHFVDWVGQLQIPKKVNSPVNIDTKAKFLNFNYTPTLQRIYNVPDANILHIHGRVSGVSSEVVLGHGYEHEKFTENSSEDELRDMDVRVYEGFEILDDYFDDTFKFVDNIILENQSFFSSLKSVDEIFIMGHSLSEVDSAYFYEIIKNINAKKVSWTISFHEDLDEQIQKTSTWGIARHLIEFKQLKNF